MKNFLKHSVHVVLLGSYFFTSVLAHILIVGFFIKQPAAIERQKSGTTNHRTAYWTQYKHIPATTTKSVQPLLPHVLFDFSHRENSCSRSVLIVVFPQAQTVVQHTPDFRAPPVL